MKTIGEVRSFLEKNMTPMVWNRLQIKLLPAFREKGFFLHTMTDEKELDDDLLALIDGALFEMYHERLPAEH